MTKAPHICFDRLLPQELSRPRPTRRMATGRAREFAPIWTEHANLHFEFIDDSSTPPMLKEQTGRSYWSA